MALEPQDIERLVKAGESETLELKTNVPSPALIASHIAAFANTSGGVLLLGVKEPAIYVGVKPTKAHLEVEEALRQLSPKLSVDFGTVKVAGTTVAYVEVAKASTLVAASGAFYMRAGDNIRPLNVLEIQSRHVSQFDLEVAIQNLSERTIKQAETIDSMSADLRKANSFWRRILLAGGSALVGAFAKHLLDVLL